MEILGIIPARGGSKGIPQKNLRKIMGKPMIQYSFDAAKKSKINKVLLTTDDKKIARFAKSLGIEAPFLRPKNLSTDSAKTFDVIKHSINYLWDNDGYSPDIVVILQPTSPLRTSQMIDESIGLLQKKNTTSVISVSKIKTHPYSAFFLKNNFLKPFRDDFKKFDRRQQYTPLYFPTGAIYTTWNDTIKKHNSIYGDKIRPMITEQPSSVDIDTKFDMFIAEMTLSNWKNYQRKFHA
ncbi:MAG: acylneuraminate cytidylyltransferase family protein [Nitrosarchaeum sp.]|nr:acylneuraminate cytidylyltransferase family protein [Nitrosarchaeum sp.]MCA9819716.1 acylneuraminate cytidylyltransferase family protein [Nitrosarchaeum sp.]